MPLLDSTRSTLVLIDLQAKLLPMVEQPATVVAMAHRLLQLAECFTVPVILTEQYPQGIGPTETSLRTCFDALATPTSVLEKTAFSCWGDPAFEPMLAKARPGLPHAKHQVVVAGIEAHVCVLQTVLELLEHGFEVHVCWDAVSGRGQTYRTTALERMAAAGATITNHESVAFEWARTKHHPAFKAISTLLKQGQPAN